MEENKEQELEKKKSSVYFWMKINGLLFVFSVLLALAIFVVINKPGQSKENEKKKIFEIVKKVENPNEGKTRRLLDGVYVEEGKENGHPIAVMIDNQIDARPQSALSRANLVIEAEAEGGVTRYMAIFDSSIDFDAVGPVRSARPYFVDWAQELSALYVHVGGSPEALVKIIQDNVWDMNEFYNGDYFWREKTKFAPHNVYISSESIGKYLESKNLSQGKFIGWQFKDDADNNQLPQEQEIKIGFIGYKYDVSWKYEKEKNIYIRYLGAEKHIDNLGGEITPKNIVIQYAGAKEIDEKLRLEMIVTGEGKAVVCRDGKCEEGKWTKKSKSSRTRFYSTSDEEFYFNAGQTWIEVVRPEREVVY